MNVDIDTVDRKYSIIYCDPPWAYSGGKEIEGSCNKHYDSMSMDDLCELGEKIKRIAADDCGLLMWVTYPKLDVIFKSGLIEKWGFKYLTMFQTWYKAVNPTWPAIPDEKIKARLGIGYYARSNNEFCILAVKGSIMKYKMPGITINSVIMEPRREHSRKPDIARTNIVDLFGDIPRIELFARQGFAGWDYWGNQTDKFDAVTVPTEIKVIYDAQDVNIKSALERYQVIRTNRATIRKTKKEEREKLKENPTAADAAPTEVKKKRSKKRKLDQDEQESPDEKHLKLTTE